MANQNYTEPYEEDDVFTLDSDEVDEKRRTSFSISL